MNVELPTEAEPVKVVCGDCRAVLPAIPTDSFDSVVTDPPYGLGEPRSNGDGSGRAFSPRTEEAKAIRRGGFMGKAWDAEVPGVEAWAAALRVLKPGGYMLCFGGTRTYHRLTCAVEDAGFEIRDCLMWLYGTGFPKGKGCLKPAWEPILLCRKPGKRVLPLGIDACRVPTDDALGGGAEKVTSADQKGNEGWVRPWMSDPAAQAAHAERVRANVEKSEALGRYPANVLHDGSDEVMEAFAAFGEKTSGIKKPGQGKRRDGHQDWRHAEGATCYADSGSAGRFFYCAKASKSERGEGNTHPTVKPLALMRWLARLVTPPGGTALDPFGGSGTTAVAAVHEGRRCLIVEKDAGYCEVIRRRVAEALCEGPGSLLAGLKQGELFDTESA